jgi:hypothetical protein
VEYKRQGNDYIMIECLTEQEAGIADCKMTDECNGRQGIARDIARGCSLRGIARGRSPM